MGTRDLSDTPVVYHLTTGLFSHMHQHGVSIEMTRGINKCDFKALITYGALTLDKKEKYFLCKELAEKMAAGHMDILPILKLRKLQRIWLPPLSAIL